MIEQKLLQRIRTFFPDPRWEVARYVSNVALRRFSNLYRGTVVNVSAWRDEDKEGKRYCDYFANATEYWMTNYKAEARGWQGGDVLNEIFLDLEEPLPVDLRGKFEVVFNHTVLEHVFDVFTAFGNLCALSSDTVIVVVPFLQEQHGEYGDFWRFTPLALRRLFQQNGLEMIYLDYNDGRGDAVYVFAIATYYPERWSVVRNDKTNRLKEIDRVFIGTRVVKKPSAPVRLLRMLLNRTCDVVTE